MTTAHGYRWSVDVVKYFTDITRVGPQAVPASAPVYAEHGPILLSLLKDHSSSGTNYKSYHMNKAELGRNEQKTNTSYWDIITFLILARRHETPKPKDQDSKAQNDRPNRQTTKLHAGKHA